MKRRDSPDGLPLRVYQRHGKQTYSIGYKSANGTWTFRLKCAIADASAVQKTRADALRRHVLMLDPASVDDSFYTMSAAFFTRQEPKTPWFAVPNTRARNVWPIAFGAVRRTRSGASQHRLAVNPAPTSCSYAWPPPGRYARYAISGNISVAIQA
jgi:hypothetical protein